MTAQLMEGAPLVKAMRAAIARDVKTLKDQGKPVCLAAIQVGAPPQSVVYLQSQERACKRVGVDFKLRQLPETVTQNGLLSAIEELNRDHSVHGIILQLPLPARIDQKVCQRALDPRKDAEGLHPSNLGLLVFGVTQRAPCTAMACYRLIKSLKQDLYGKEAVVVGHSEIVGKPISMLLLHDYCTTTTCHVATQDLAAHTRRADLIVVAVGKPGLITAEMVKPGAIVVDVGINSVPVLDADGKQHHDSDGEPLTKIVGDVDFGAVKQVAGYLTPVPGGVGPVTVVMLLRNVVEAAKQLYRESDRADGPTPMLPFGG